MNKKLKNVLERHIDTVWAIAASKYVSQFVIGLTSQPSEKRFAQYRQPKVGYDHLVVLSNGWSCQEALWLEGELQRYCKDTEAQEIGFPDKYQRNAREDVHRKSLGGKSSKLEGDDEEGSVNSEEYLVYLAWWEPEEF